MQGEENNINEVLLFWIYFKLLLGGNSKRKLSSNEEKILDFVRSTINIFCKYHLRSI